MKKFSSVSLLALAALLPLGAQAQVLCALGPAATPPYDPMADMPASDAAQKELKKVKGLLCPKGCGKVLLFANATSPNAATVTDGAGLSKIAYSPKFVSSLQTNFGPIATLGVFAHGLGHHLDATGTKAGWMKESWDAELRADAWAGCAMAKAELTPSRLQAVLLAMSTYPSTQHPDWNVRRPVITEGYTKCGGKILPTLARESSDQSGKGDAGKGDAGKGEASKGAAGKDETAGASVGPKPAGCASDKDCRKGRACVSGRCTAAPVPRRCGKDTDCPDPQECDSSGHCSEPTGQARAQAQGNEDAAKASKPMLAALKTERPDDTAACQRACDDTRNQCIEAAPGEVTKCQAAIQAETNYRSCSCPNYPSGDYVCYGVCTSAYERTKSCSTANRAQECKTEGDRCRSQCR
jgi:hypothetical protein